MTDAHYRDELKQACADQLTADGHLHGWLRTAFAIVPREAFVPDRVWWPVMGPDGTFPVRDRTADPRAWLEAVYDPHRPLITQMDDHLDPSAGPAAGRFSSSISAPDIVCPMLHHLDVPGGHGVLEIGTGSGYNAAMLCERVGSSNVITVEIDERIVHHARQSLYAAGYRPHVRCGDGTRQVHGAAPFDRVIATASTRAIPYAWIEGTVPGGAILAPHATTTGPSGLVLLRVDEAGAAAGRFVELVDFMPLRGQVSQGDAVARLRESTWDAAETATVEGDLGNLGDNRNGLFALWARHPTLRAARNPEGTWWLSSTDLTSWAAARPRPDGESFRVKRHGPHDLFAELAEGAEWWRVSGWPEVARFGLTVTGEGETVWLDSPGRPVAAGLG
ncbi:methyltransferase domain-containing protein [Streptomyces sp. NPDC003077]|uniref:methyltransferase domain-containing protein n=1 Tax=Streptomyces sp. NPDC003077 TaxID=3154443 RepID=UPI0033B87C5F